jgi:lambda family phage minor tail protein L
MPIPFAEAQLPAPSALIELFELQLFAAIHGVDQVYRFHAGINAKQTGDVVWAGNTYEALPIEAEGFALTGTGSLPRPTLRVANIPLTINNPFAGGLISGLLLSLPNGLEGAQVSRVRVHARHLDAVNFPGNVNPWGTPDPTYEYPRQVYWVDQKKAETREVVEFELCATFDLSTVRAPRFQIVTLCQWTSTTQCQFAPNCGKRLSDCKNNWGANNQLPFGGFPGAGTSYT